MASLSDLEAAIDELLDHPLGAAHFQLVTQTAEKAYEAYVFGLCLRAAREVGAVPELRGIAASPVPFVFRGGPGKIFSDLRNYGYAYFAMNGQGFEVHLNVEFKGTSGMLHELDVSILRHVDANKCRTRSIDPSTASLIAGWECKFYGGRLDKNLGRAFVGLIDDMGANVRLSGMCSNSTHPQLRDYFRPARRPHPHFLLTPLNKSNEDVFVNVLKAELKKATSS